MSRIKNSESLPQLYAICDIPFNKRRTSAIDCSRFDPSKDWTHAGPCELGDGLGSSSVETKSSDTETRQLFSFAMVLFIDVKTGEDQPEQIFRERGDDPLGREIFSI